MNRLDVAVLHGLETQIDGVEVAIRGTRGRQLLAVLALADSAPLSMDRIIDALWGDNPPASARNSIQRFVSDLRRDLFSASDRLETSPSGYRLRLEAEDRLDVQELERVMREAEHAASKDEQGDTTELLGFVDLLSSVGAGAEPLARLTDAPELQAHQARLLELVAAACELRIRLLLNAGQVDRAIVEATELCARHPLREVPQIQQATALARKGRAADALDGLHRFTTTLREELGLDPSPALAHTEREILQHLTTLDKQTPVVVESAAPAATKLWTNPDELVGRGDDIETVAELLQPGRWVTVTGPGGIGKTSVANAVGHLVADRFLDGAWAIDLAAVTQDADVAPAAVASLDIALVDGQAPAELLGRALTERQVLLIVDNCEHVAAGVAQLAVELRDRAPLVTVLATSRRHLDIRGERIWRLPPLATLDGSGPAVDLFEKRASDLVTGFRLVTERDRAAAALLCDELDGNALAIELAASRVVSMSVPDIAARLGDRFRLLRSSEGGRPERHRTLLASLEWSLELLDAQDRNLLERLAVLPGGFDLQAAAALAPDGFDEYEVLDALDRLVRSSLIQADRNEIETRYRQLDTVRHHGTAQLAACGSWTDTRRIAVSHFATEAERRFESYGGLDTAAALTWTINNRANLRIAHRWALELHDLQSAVTIAAVSAIMGWQTLWYEPSTWAEALIEPAQEAGVDHLSLLHTGAGVCAFAGRPDAGRQYLSRAIELALEGAAGARDLASTTFLLRQANRYLSGPVFDESFVDQIGQLDEQFFAEAPRGGWHVAAVNAALSEWLPDSRAIELAAELPLDTGFVTHDAINCLCFARTMRLAAPTDAITQLRRGLQICADQRLGFFGAVMDGTAAMIEVENGRPLVSLEYSLRALNRFDVNILPTARSGLLGASLALGQLGETAMAARILGALGSANIVEGLVGHARERLEQALGVDECNALMVSGSAEPIESLVREVRTTISGLL